MSENMKQAGQPTSSFRFPPTITGMRSGMKNMFNLRKNWKWFGVGALVSYGFFQYYRFEQRKINERQWELNFKQMQDYKKSHPHV